MRVSLQVGVLFCLIAPGGAAQSEFLRFESVMAGDQTGAAVASAGDVDGDGYADVVVGSPLFDAPSIFGTPLDDAGRVVVYSGRTGAVLLQYQGSGFNEQLGYSVAGVGDANADGVVDVAFGRPGLILTNPFGTFLGGALVVSGSSGATIVLASGFSHGFTYTARMGHALAALGDVNGDGKADVAVSAPLATQSGMLEAGGAYLYSGANLFLVSYNGTQAGEHYGWSIGNAGDTNNDGNVDIIGGAPERDVFFISNFVDAGRFDVRTASTGAVLFGLTGGFAAGLRLGASVAGLGDIDGDGRGDLAVGVPGSDVAALTDAGRVTLYSGTGTALANLNGLASGDQLGRAVAGPGDVTGDGTPDILGGASLSDVGSMNAGRAFLYSGASLAQVIQIGGSTSNQLVGAALAGAGDVDGDGRADFLVGAPGGSGSPITPGFAALWVAAGCDASRSNYGAGLAGTLGVPQLTLQHDPELCSSNFLEIGNSAGVTTPATLFLGVQQASLNTGFGAPLLVAPPWITISLILPPGLSSLPVSTPCDSTLCGVDVYLQVLETDVGAPQQVSFTKGLFVHHGN